MQQFLRKEIPTSKRAELLYGFSELPGDALIDVATLAALRDRSESATWLDLRTDPAAPKTIKVTARCTRVRVGDARRWVRGASVDVAFAAPLDEVTA